MIANFQLTEHFTFWELSGTLYDELVEENRRLALKQTDKLTAICHLLLEPIRTHFKLPVKVLSGFRCSELNAKIGSKAESQHAKAEAVDFIIPGLDDEEGMRAVFQWLWMESDLKWGQLILEKAKRPYGTARWIHISLGEPYRSAEICQQVLRMIDGEYKFLDRANA